MRKIYTFFGHRDVYLSEAIRAKIRTTLIDLIEKEGVDSFWFGSCGKFDAGCTGITRSLKKRISAY